MNNIDYYKSLISDEEVIKALIKESKAREGELLKEKTRVRPNLNFFQRTVTNLISSNRRIPTTKELECTVTQKPLFKATKKMKVQQTLTKDKIDFIKAADSGGALGEKLKEQVSSVKPCNSTSAVEKVYKEDLSKYFVCSSERTQINGSGFNATTKSKSIVFNLNINKDRLKKPSLNREFLRRDKESVTVSEVIYIPSSPSSSSDCEVVQVSESESD